MPDHDALGYDVAMASRYDEDWAAIAMTRDDGGFYSGLVAETEGLIVEVGAGTGRVTLPVAHAAGPGRRVVGVEPSARMRQAFETRVRADASAADLDIDVRDGHFGAIPCDDHSVGYLFSAFRAFQHLQTVPAQLEALAEMRRVLAPGGLLAFDLFDPDPALLTSTDWELMVETPLPSASGGGTRARWDRRDHDRLLQLVHVFMRWETASSEGAPEVVTSDYVVRYLFRYELEHLLARAGWDEFTLYGGFDKSPVDTRHRELIVVARRR